MSEDKKQMLCSPFCDPGMLEDLEKCRVMEIFPDVFFIEGYAGTAGFFSRPPSGNIFIMRDGDTVLVEDSGHHPFYRDKMLAVLKKFKDEGAKELILTMSHGHWDHGKNNDVIFEAGYEKARFLLAEPEFHTLNIAEHLIGDQKKLFKYYDPCKSQNYYEGLKQQLEYFKMFPAYKEPKFQKTWKMIEALTPESSTEEVFAAWCANMKNVMASDLSSYIIDKAEPLKLKDREKRTIGGQEVLGWPVGRFFLIHEASQSPGHISVYDPKYKLMITGDATLEINPPFFDCDLNNCIDFCAKCLEMAKKGEILAATDMHRTSQFWPKCIRAWGLEPINRAQEIDVARGQQECIDFYQFWLDYHTAQKEEVLKAHARIGKATVEEIVTELRKSTNKYVQFKLGLTLPYIPCFPHTQVIKVLEENGCVRHVEGGKVLFSPLA